MEAWGNLEKKEDRTTAQSLEYATRVMETSLGTVYFATRSAILARSSYLRRCTGLVNLADDIPLSRFKAFATAMGYGLAFLAGMAAFFKALDHYGKDETGQGHLQLTESLGLLMIVYGELATTRLGAKLLVRAAGEKTGKWLAGRLAPVLLGVGNMISVLILILTFSKDIIDISDWTNTPEVKKMLKAFWESIEAQPALTCYESASTWVDENGDSHNSRPNGPAHIVYIGDMPRQRQITAGRLYFENKSDQSQKDGKEGPTPAQRRDRIRELIDQIPFRHLNWRAVVPLYKGGYEMEKIKKLVSITGAGLAKPYMQTSPVGDRSVLKWDMVRYTKDLINAASARYGTDMERVGQVEQMVKKANETERIAMGPDELIQFYEMISAPSVEKKQFASGKTYGQVAEALQKGTFTPDRAKPELLPEQQAYTKDNLKALSDQYPDLSLTFVSGDWSSPDFYE